MDFAHVRKYFLSLAGKFLVLTKKGYKPMDANVFKSIEVNACSDFRNSLVSSKHKDCFTTSGCERLFDAARSFSMSLLALTLTGCSLLFLVTSGDLRLLLPQNSPILRLPHLIC